MITLFIQGWTISQVESPKHSRMACCCNLLCVRQIMSLANQANLVQLSIFHNGPSDVSGRIQANKMTVFCCHCIWHDEIPLTFWTLKITSWILPYITPKNRKARSAGYSCLTCYYFAWKDITFLHGRTFKEWHSPFRSVNHIRISPVLFCWMYRSDLMYSPPCLTFKTKKVNSIIPISGKKAQFNQAWPSLQGVSTFEIQSAASTRLTQSLDATTTT